MSPIENEYGPHAAQMKHALRNAKKRCSEAGAFGKTVTVRSVSLVSTNPPRSGLSSQQEEAIDLGIDGIVFFPLLAQVGVPCADNEEEYFAMQATEFVIWRTQGVDNDEEAFDILEPYYRAIMNLP
jgi:hypothetical protein